MSRCVLVAIAMTLILASTPMRAANREQLPADIVTGLLPLAAYAITRYKGDDMGEGELLRSNVASLVATSTLRLAFNQTSWGRRPNGKGYGFPSGHVAFATSSAAFLEDRYGWRYGVPAYMLAGYVAYVRVNTGYHRWRDVAASGALSYGISKLFVTPLNATHLAPVVGPGFFELRWERSF